MARRRRWAASGRLPPALAARFTLAEQAVLSRRRGRDRPKRRDCRLAVGHLAAIAGVAETTVRNAIREARKLGLVTIEERRHHRLPQRHERGPHRIGGVDGLAAAGPSGDVGPATGGRVQIREGHDYSSFIAL